MWGPLLAWLDDADIRQGPVLLRIVQSVPDDPFIADAEAEIIDVYIDHSFVLLERCGNSVLLFGGENYCNSVFGRRVET